TKAAGAGKITAHLGRSLPFGGQQIFLNFPLSTPLPLDTASNYPRKEILKAVQTGSFFRQKISQQLSTRERTGGNDEDS
ncbi:hypothetical protein D3Z53_26285, partial [Lachnospiraceae bacterium]|nr:hypothetical protein [Lachnospiraceae bacterium]